MSATATGNRMAKESMPRMGWTEPLQLAVYVGVSFIIAALLLERVTWQESLSSRDLTTPLWAILVGIVSNAGCAILGCYLVLRRMSLLGDAISHAVLPGIALGYLFSGSVTGLPILLGAMALGVLTSVLTQGLTS